MDYFSDREKGPRPRTKEEITPEAWGGIIALIRSLISIGAFGFKYPEMCPDGADPVGTDEEALALALKAEIPEIEWPLQAPTEVIIRGGQDQESYVPDTFIILDLIQFSYQAVAKPIQGGYHEFFRHHHLTFDEDSGREQFRSTVNSILARKGIAYQLRADGSIERLAPPLLKDLLANTVFRTKDITLNQMLEDARRKFLNPDPVVLLYAESPLSACGTAGNESKPSKDLMIKKPLLPFS